MNKLPLFHPFRPEMYDFARRIRAEATGVLQRFQIIQNEQRRKKQEALFISLQINF